MTVRATPATQKAIRTHAAQLGMTISNYIAHATRYFRKDLTSGKIVNR